MNLNDTLFYEWVKTMKENQRTNQDKRTITDVNKPN